jgi:hypothetical protein
MAKAPHLGICTRIQQQRSTTAQLGSRPNLILDLTIDGLCRPRRVSHQVLDVVTRLAGGTLRASAVPLLRHTQQRTQVVICIGRLVPRLGPEAMAKTGPEVHQAISHACNGLYRQSPAVWVRYHLSYVSLVVHLLVPQLRQSIKCATQCS